MISWSEELQPTWILHRGIINGKTVYRVREYIAIVTATCDVEEGMDDRHRPVFDSVADAKQWCEMHHAVGA